jgi:hypothetical protein
MLRAVTAADTPGLEAVACEDSQDEVIDLTEDDPSPPREPTTRPRRHPDLSKRRRC